MDSFCVSIEVFNEVMMQIENNNVNGSFYSENGISLTGNEGYKKNYRFHNENSTRESIRLVSNSAKTINSIGAIHYYDPKNLSKASQEHNKPIRTLFKEFKSSPCCNSSFSLFNIDCKRMPWAYDMDWSNCTNASLIYADVFQVGPCLTKGHLDQYQLAGVSCIAPWITGLEKVWFVVKNSLRYTNDQLLKTVRKTHHADGRLMSLTEQNDAQVKAYLSLKVLGLIHVIVQKPGQVLYIPSGMAHAVLTSFNSVSNPSFVSLLIGASILPTGPSKSVLSTIGCSLKQLRTELKRKCSHLSLVERENTRDLLRLKIRREAERQKSRGPPRRKNKGRYVLSADDKRRRTQSNHTEICCDL